MSHALHTRKDMVKTMKEVAILNPLPEIKAEEAIEPVRRLDTVKGKVIGLLDGNKPYGDVVMGIIQDFLEQQGVKEFVSAVKPFVTKSTPEDMINKICKADAVVISFADCGSCSTAVATDIVAIEKKGVPCVAVITDHFAPHFARIVEGLGAPDAPMIVVPHPLGDNATKEIAEEKAKKIVNDVVQALTLPISELKSRYSAHRWIELRGEL